MKGKPLLLLLGLLTLSSINVPALSQANPTAGIQRPVLRIGSQGDYVSQVQAALKLLGYYTGEVSGIYNESTVIAVSRFQEAAKLNVDGIVGLATWISLFPVTPPQNSTATIPSNNPTATATTLPILREGMQGEAVVKLQKRLIALGLLSGSADGSFGQQTLAAVQAAQASFNLAVDGVVGAATWRALLK
ncbi:MAG: peptidoglycan-binding protein [Spirulinaceae cyanobacterium]